VVSLASEGLNLSLSHFDLSLSLNLNLPHQFGFFGSVWYTLEPLFSSFIGVTFDAEAKDLP
jgi:hypothetical protein